MRFNKHYTQWMSKTDLLCIIAYGSGSEPSFVSGQTDLQFWMHGWKREESRVHPPKTGNTKVPGIVSASVRSPVPG
jgi:hypothetical protein